jgi:hypothetical protein
MAVLERHEVRQHALRAWHATSRLGLHEAVIVVVSFLIYFAVRGMVVDRAGQAMVNAFDLIALEQKLGIYWELRMQSWILDSYVLIKTMNWIYFWGHMPLVILFAVWLWMRHREAYTLVRNAFLASGAIGIASQGERAVIIGDASHHPVQLEHPDWSPAFDTDPVLSAQSRDRLFDDCVADGRTWIAGHWQHPGFGRIVGLEGKRVFQAL